MDKLELDAIALAVFFVILTVAVGVTGYKCYHWGESVQLTSDQVATDKLKQEQQSKYDQAMADQATLKQERDDATNKFNNLAATQSADTNAAHSRNASSVYHDPYATRCRSSGSGAVSKDQPATNDSTADSADATPVLSKQLTDFLNNLAFKADKINDAYTACRAERNTLTSPLSLKMSDVPETVAVND